jgi:hypothetical protein
MKLTEITPKQFQCGIGACRAIFKTDNETYIIIGRNLTNDLPPELTGRIAPHETAIEVPKELLSMTREMEK